MIAASRQMEKASHELPPVTSVNEGLPLYFLTGKNYLYQTLFCIRSLVLVSKPKFRLVLIDDGSFNEALIARIKKQLPGAEIITKEAIEQNLQRIIPAAQYPYLHKKRVVYPHIKKLTDIHTIPGDWKLVLDSDMLFWHEPLEILEWLNNPGQPIHMIDCGEAYGYSNKLMEQLAGKTIKPLINVGAIGLNSNTMNWQNLESWAAALEQQEGTSYYLEQALSAMLMGDDSATVLPPGKYIVNPVKAVIAKQNGLLHHYVDLSKEGYFKLAWKKLV